MAVPVRADLMATLADLGARRLRAMSRGLGERRQRLGDLVRALPRPEQILADRRQRLDVAIARLPRLEQLILNARNNLEKRALRLGQSLRERLRVEQRRLSERSGRFGPWLLTGRIQKARARLDGLVRLFASLHYENTLKRGYAVVRSDSAVLTRAAQVHPGMGLELEFADGRVRAEAKDGGPAPASKAKPRRKKPPAETGGGQGSLF